MKIFPLGNYGEHLWTRELAKEIRRDLIKVLDNSEPEETIAIDTKGVKVFDYSFANEFFGKTILSLPGEYPDRCLVVENLSEYTRENLSKALESLSLVMLEKRKRNFKLIGKVHPADEETLGAILKAGAPTTASELKEKLSVTLTAMNERLTKLTDFAIVRRGLGKSKAGRQQFEYSGPG